MLILLWTRNAQPLIECANYNGPWHYGAGGYLTLKYATRHLSYKRLDRQMIASCSTPAPRSESMEDSSGRKELSVRAH